MRIPKQYMAKTNKQVLTERYPSLEVDIKRLSEEEARMALTLNHPCFYIEACGFKTVKQYCDLAVMLDREEYVPELLEYLRRFHDYNLKYLEVAVLLIKEAYEKEFVFEKSDFSEKSDHPWETLATLAKFSQDYEWESYALYPHKIRAIILDKIL